MSKREKIIIGVMLAVVVFGGTTFWGGSSKRLDSGTNQDAEPLNQFIAQAAVKLNRTGEDVSRYILKKATMSLDRDPFLDPEIQTAIVPEKQESKDTDIPLMQYSGYLQAGARRLAIINGTEYEPGDTIEPAGYIVKRVTPEQVILRTPGNERLVLPISVNE